MLTINIKQKKYGKKIVLNDINIQISEPGIYGLIGGNGEGKTTLFKCIAGLEKYDGEVLLNNEKLSLQNTAFCSTEPFVYDELTTVEFYTFYANLLGLNTKELREFYKLPTNELIKNFSTGMKKKAYLNAVFQKDYAVYLLNEPFNGLDLESNYILIKYLQQKSRDSIIFISSHIIDILFKNCSSIYVLKNKDVMQFNSDKFSDIEFLLENVSL